MQLMPDDLQHPAHSDRVHRASMSPDLLQPERTAGGLYGTPAHIPALIGTLLLPLAIIAGQHALGLHGVANSIYKLCFLIPPWIYCRKQGIGVYRDILKFAHWRRCLGIAVGLATLAIVI